MKKINSYNVQSADLIVGIPSYNEADNIAFVVQQCNLGLTKYFPYLSSAIVNVDNDSPDDTRNVFLNSVNTIPKIYISTPPGVRGKGNNFYNLFNEARRLKARAVVVVDADITSITPEWIRDLATPILLHNFDFVTPLYSRNEYDGTITNHICYPLIYGLLGRDVRQPIGGDFAFSSNLVNCYLTKSWHETTFQFGIDIFMTLNALINEYNTCQVKLGTKVHKPSAPKLDLMFSQVVATLFNTLIDAKNKWTSNHGIKQLPLFGENNRKDPQALSIDYKSMKSVSLKQYYAYQAQLSQNLCPRTFIKIDEMYKSGKINIGSGLWSKIVFDLLYAYEKTQKDPNVIEALKPLYFGRIISFIRQTLELDHIASEMSIQKQAKYFYNQKKYMLSKYVN